MEFLSGNPRDSLAASVLIPTRGRARLLERCLGALARQEGAGSFEVLVGLDGPDAESEAVTARFAARGVRCIPCARGGLMAVRERLVAEARGRLMISINDDVEPCAGFIAAHVEGHAEAERRTGGPAVIVGDSPWKVHSDDSLFDRLVRETSMIFFYDRMRGEQDRWRDWGFRHCWGLNFSAPLGLVREVGGFRGFTFAYGYEDIELGYRLAQRFGAPVLFRPAARAEHDHRYRPADVLAREFQLGRAAWLFAGAAPEFARAVFGREIRSADEVAYSEAYLAREESLAARLRGSFLKLAELPASLVGGQRIGGSDEVELLNLLYQQHLALKRWMWRAGLADAARGGTGEVRWPSG
ncbi:MAG: glycosyltransferase family 2 protein [Phycisphaerales bacterium]|nr:glycosyltransferase family 2 protein [Phycisphaerales bacterium]